MIKFKKNYYQMKTNGNKLSIRFANYRVSPDYLYDAFKDKDGDNDYMYIAAYPGSKRLDGNILSASSEGHLAKINCPIFSSKVMDLSFS